MLINAKKVTKTNSAVGIVPSVVVLVRKVKFGRRAFSCITRFCRVEADSVRFPDQARVREASTIPMTMQTYR